jgi:hypothetical protein
MPAPKKSRTVGKHGMGSPGDVRDRFRGAYKPGAYKHPEPGLANPVRQVGDLIKRLRTPKPKKRG